MLWCFTAVQQFSCHLVRCLPPKPACLPACFTALQMEEALAHFAVKLQNISVSGSKVVYRKVAWAWQQTALFMTGDKWDAKRSEEVRQARSIHACRHTCKHDLQVVTRI